MVLTERTPTILTVPIVLMEAIAILGTPHTELTTTVHTVHIPVTNMVLLELLADVLVELKKTTWEFIMLTYFFLQTGGIHSILKSYQERMFGVVLTMGTYTTPLPVEVDKVFQGQVLSIDAM